MSNIGQIGDLQVSQDLDYQRREWKFERIGWCCMAGIVISALFGLLGTGPLSHAKAGRHGDPIWMEYNRFLHRHEPAELTIYFTPVSPSSNEAQVWFDSDYLKKIEIRSINPEPDHSIVGPARQIFVFKVEKSEQPMLAVIHYEANEIGPAPGRLGLVDGPTVSFRQFVYP